MIIQKIEKVYQEYSTELYRYLLSLTHSPTDAEDLLSETFIRALKNLASFRGDSSLRTWLYSIARNVWLEHVRKLRDTVSIDDMLGDYIDDNILDTVSTKMMVEFVRKQLAAMDERTRTIVFLRSEGYSYEEIAAKLRITANSARVIEHRTKKKLKKLLLKEGFMDE